MPDKSLLIQEGQDFLEEFQDLQFRYNIYLATLAAELQCPVDQRTIIKSQMVDLGFLCREVRNVAKDLRKQAEAHQNAFSVVICRKIMAHVLQYPSAPERADGTLASASSNIKPMPRIPKQGTPEHEVLCDYFSIPESAQGVVDFGFKNVGAFLLREAHEGRNVPIEMTQPAGTEFDVIYRTKKRSKRKDAQIDE